MANRSVTFNGKTFTNPGIYSAIDSAMTYSKTSENARIIALIGECTGGAPDTVHFFSNPAVAKKVLKSGELLKACNKAWNPVTRTKEGLQLGGADIIACIRANKATRAQKNIYASESSPAVINDIIEMVSSETTGTMVVTGDYTGTENATYVVEITNGGTYTEAATGEETTTDVTFNYYMASRVGEYINKKDTPASEELLIPDTGLTVSFTQGVYTTGDTFTVSVFAAVNTETPMYAFVSKDYGKDNNKLQVKIEDGSLDKSKKITIYNVKTDSYEVFDNLGFAFRIVYTGTENYAAISIITDGNGNAVKLQTYIGEDKANAVVDLDVDLDKSAFKTIRALVKYLQGFDNYNVIYDTYCNTFCSVNSLDCVANANIKGESFVVTQMLSDIQAKLENDSTFVTVEIYNKENAKVENMPFITLAGGTEGRVPASWVEYFDMLSKYDIQYVVPLTSDDYILAECVEHVKEMSETFGLERRAVCGTDNGKTVSEAITIAQNLADGRCQFVYPGFYDLNERGETELYPTYILAAQHAGRCSFLPDGETTTHDVYRMAAIEKELEPEEIAQLLNAGVVTFEFKISNSVYDESYVQCVQDITTSQADDILEVERAVGVTADNINKAIRKAVENLTIGRKTVVGTLQTVRNTVISVLEKKRDKEEVIVAFKDVNVYTEGGAMYIEYACAPAQPTNFAFITGHFYSENLMLSDTETMTED